MHTGASQHDLGLDHGPGLMRLALRLAGSQEAEDLVQSTWLRALEHGQPVHKRRAWLNRVLVNERNMAVRGKVRRDDRERGTVTGDDPVDLEHVVHSLEVARVVQDLVDGLDDDVRLVVRERYFEGSSAADIARRHSIPAGTVRWRLKSGLDRLRDQLDARYGGRRALWAGGLIPGALSPTLEAAPASAGTTAGGTTSAAAGKGISAMTAKLIAAAAILVAGTATAAAVTSNDSDRKSHDSPAAVAAAASLPGPTAEREASPDGSKPANPAQQRWSHLRSKIRAAHASHVASKAEPSEQPQDAAAAQEPCEDDVRVGPCTGDDCVNNLTSQILAMVDGCDEFLAGSTIDLTVKAKVIGAPDIGSVVESVEVDAAEPLNEDLHECLTESMYTLDLGPTQSDFEQVVQLMIGHQNLRASEFGDGITMVLPHERFHKDAEGGVPLPEGVELDEQTQTKIDQLLAEHGEGTVRSVMVGSSQPQPED